jgi:hypothetical protein
VTPRDGGPDEAKVIVTPGMPAQYALNALKRLRARRRQQKPAWRRAQRVAQQFDAKPRGSPTPKREVA